MDPVVTVDADTVTVEPGGQASVTVRVRNLSSIVEGFRLDVLGEASSWARVLPDRVEVLPQGEALATVLFTPPSGVNTRAGQVPFGVRVVSQVDAGASAVAEGDLQVGNVSLSQAKLTPVTSKGRLSSRHRLEFSNWGNTPVRLKLEASDPDGALGFLLSPEHLDLPLGTARAARLKVRARKPFFRGAPQRRTFRVVGHPLEPGRFDPMPGPAPQPYGYDPTHPAVDGAFEQRPIIGRGLLPLALVAVVAAGAIGYLSSRPDKNPADETVAPPPPQSFAAQAVSHDTARLRWQPGDRIDSYTVLVIDPATAEDPTPRVIDTTKGVPGEQGQFEVVKLTAHSRNCFQLVAVRGKASSAPSPVQCVTTAEVNPPGAPAPPTDVNVRVENGKALITWSDPSKGKADHIIRRGDTIVATVDHPLNEKSVDIIPDELCYTVESSVGDAVSPPSDQQCLPPGTQSDGSLAGAGSGGQAGADLKIIAVPDGGLILLDDPAAKQLALQRLSDVRTKGITQANLLLSSEYPGFSPPLALASYVVYIPGFESIAQAKSYCATKGLTCQTFTPGPRGSVAPGGAGGTGTGTGVAGGGLPPSPTSIPGP